MEQFVALTINDINRIGNNTVTHGIMAGCSIIINGIMQVKILFLSIFEEPWFQETTKYTKARYIRCIVILK